MKRTTLIIFLSLLTAATFGQKAKIDSVQALIKQDSNDTIKVAHLNYLASLYSIQKKFKEAEKHLLNSLSLAETTTSLNAMATVHYDLSELYRETGKPAKELEHYKDYILLRDSIVSNEKNNSSLSKADTIKTEAEATTEKSKKIAILAILVSALLLFFTIRFLLRLTKANKLNKLLIEQQQPLRTSNEELNKKKAELEGFGVQQKQILEEQKQMIEKYSPIVSSSEELKKQVVDLKENSREQKQLLEKYTPIINVDAELTKRKNELSNIISDYEKNLAKQQELQKEVNLLEENLENIDYGFYKPHYPFKTSTEYKIEMEKVTDNLKEMIKNNEAAICKVEWTVGDSKTEGKKMIKQMTKLMLRAFNGESDSAIARVSWSNVVTMEARINKSYETINNFGETMQITIAENYKDLKLKELYLNFELEEKQYKEKEEQRKIKEQMREEEKAQKEMERAMKDAQDEEKRYEKALEKAKQDVEQAKGKELDELNEKIRIYEERLQNAHENKERAVSRAQLTKSGYVYVISNIGSFGENIYKIGMTRRLDPQDRVDELGDASVPFDFDVHGFIYSENAPQLEYDLHTHFEMKRVNLVNYRTEFFKVSIDEIEVRVKELNLKVELTKLAMAKEYRETVSLIQANNTVKS